MPTPSAPPVPRSRGGFWLPIRICEIPSSIKQPSSAQLCPMASWQSVRGPSCPLAVPPSWTEAELASSLWRRTNYEEKEPTDEGYDATGVRVAGWLAGTCGTDTVPQGDGRGWEGGTRDRTERLPGAEGRRADDVQVPGDERDVGLSRKRRHSELPGKACRVSKEAARALPLRNVREPSRWSGNGTARDAIRKS